MATRRRAPAHEDRSPFVVDVFYEDCPPSKIPGQSVVYLRTNPMICNGVVHAHRYRVTIEAVPEDPAVIAERVQALHDGPDGENHHNSMPLHAAAAKLGYQLKPRKA